MVIVERVEGIALPILEKIGAFLVETLVRGENRGKVLELLIDTDEGVTTGQCAAVSRELSLALDAAEVFRGSYQLIVSSPGTDNPLKFFRQYRKNIGRIMTIRTRAASNPGPFQGTLTELEGETVVLRLTQSGEIMKIAHTEIAEARVQTPW